MDFAALLAESYSLWSDKAECDLSINCWREKIQSGQGVNTHVLYKSFGIRPYITSLPAGAVWGGYELNGHCYFIVGDTLYDFIGQALNGSFSGLLPSNSRPYLAASQNTLMICWGGKLYRNNASTLVEIPLSFVPIDVFFIKNLFGVVSSTGNQFYWSEDDGATFPADLVQTAEADANMIVRSIVLNKSVWLIGTRITQLFYIGQNPNKPFIPNDSADIRCGTNAPASAQLLGTSIIMLGQTAEGSGSIVRSNGYGFDTVSNFYAATVIGRLSEQSDAIGMGFSIDDHDFYRITFPSGDKTLEFHSTQNEWEETPWWNWIEGQYHRHRGNCITAAFGKILVGDHTNGIIYEMSRDIYTDFGFPIRLNRRCPHIIEDGKRVEVNRIELGMETGVGLTEPLWLPNYSLDAATFAAALAAAVIATTVTADQALVLQDIYDFKPYIPLEPYPTPQVMHDLGFDPWGAQSAVIDPDDATKTIIIGTPPQMVMKYSRVGAKVGSFTNEQSKSIGTPGEDDKQVYWNNCGMARDFVFDFVCTDPVRIAITQGMIEAKAMSA